jgi:hypothetical protein
MDELKPEDLSFSAYPETIAGGMHVGMPNGVLATHLPTGIKVVCNHYRSQHQNRDACLLAIASARNPRAASGGDSASMEQHSDGMLPDELVQHSKEWYRLCERRFSVERMTISGELAEAIVACISRLNEPSGDSGQLSSLEQRARELLAAAYEKDSPGNNTSVRLLAGEPVVWWSDEISLRAITAALANQQGLAADALRYAAYFRWLMRGKNLELAAALMAKDQYATLRRLCESLVPLDDVSTQPAGDVGSERT